FRLDRMRGVRAVAQAARPGVAARLRDAPPGYVRQVLALRPDARPRATLWQGHDRADGYHPPGLGMGGRRGRVRTATAWPTREAPRPGSLRL
ncbi:MAG: hypothetical protein WBA35_11580, partial [Litorimonas sp.]